MFSLQVWTTTRLKSKIHLIFKEILPFEMVTMIQQFSLCKKEFHKRLRTRQVSIELNHCMSKTMNLHAP